MTMLSPADVAERCGVSITVVRRAITRGELPASKVFGRVRVDERDLAAYIEASRIGGAEPQRRRPAAARRRRESASGSLQELNRRAA